MSTSYTGCKLCRNLEALDFEITMAFQPIVNITSRTVFAYEALVRGKSGESAGDVLARVNDDNRYRFDQTCRTTAIELASKLGMQSLLSINFLPNAVYRPASCIRATLEAAERFEFPASLLMFEVTEAEPVRDPAHLGTIFDEYQEMGFTTAIDDFGSGYAGLNLLSQFKPQIIKLDMELCQGVASDAGKRILTDGVVHTATRLGIKIVAEGIENIDDFFVLREMGVELFQGFLFARPEIERLPAPDFSIIDSITPLPGAVAEALSAKA